MINDVAEKNKSKSVADTINFDEKPWTDDQRLAINTVDKGVVVSAAAGSGKTAVLIERTIKMLTDPKYDIPADSLLAVTFTNDAANQMKSKLSQAMSDRLEKEPENQWIAKQQELLSMANICTIDAFCMDLVRSNINQFELSGNFTIISSEENKILQQKALADTSDYFFKNQPETMKILMDNFANENDGNVIIFADKLLNFIYSIPFKNQWKRSVIDKLENSDFEKYKHKAFKLIIKYLDNLKDIYVDLMEILAESQDELRQRFEDALENIEKVQDLENGLSYDERLLMSKDIIFNNLRTSVLTANVKKGLSGIMAAKKKEITALKNKFEGQELYFEKQLKSDAEKTKIIFEALWEFVEKAASLLNEYKVDKNKAYFSDVTRMTIELLAIETDDGFKRTELSQKIVDDKLYKIILIDEFQDVNNLQEVIFNCISDTDDLNMLGKNVFVVGDVKQSIYGFRQSNPRIFKKVREFASKDENESNVEIVLKKNFRSRSNVIDFTNFIFENIMSKELGEVEYSGSELLELGAKFDDNNPETEILLLNTEDNDIEDSEESKNQLDYECKAVAIKINEMIDNKVQVYVGGDKQTRDCRPGDFCILSRTTKKAGQFIQALESVGIKGVTDSIKGYLGAREVSLAFSMLKVIDNPLHDISFAAVCLSPIFAFTADEMAKIRIAKKGKKLYQVFLAICRDDESKELGFDSIDINDELLTEKCQKTISLLRRLRFFSSGMSLEKLIRKLFDVTDFMSIASSFENSQQKRANLRMLIKYAADFEKSTGGGLSDFLRYMDNIAQSNGDFDEALTVTAGEDTVIIKTIHKSKGLEFPFVIVGGLEKEFNYNDLRKQFIINQYTGVGIRLRNTEANINVKTQIYDEVYNSNKLEMISEEIRILYVALTRAKERLILPMVYCLKENKSGNSSSAKTKKLYLETIESLKNNKKLLPSVIENIKSYRDLIGAALLTHPNREEFLDFLDLTNDPEIPTLETNSRVVFNEIQLSLSEIEDEKEFVLPSKDMKLFSEIVKNIEYKENQHDVETISKLTVTEIVREIEGEQAKTEITYFSPIPNMICDDKKATAAEKGTYTHLFMEIADFVLASQDVNKELDRLVSINKMTSEQASNVNVSSIEKFFESQLYNRYKAALNVLKEKKFMAKLSDMKFDNSLFKQYNDKEVMIQGIADLLIEEDDGYLLVDYKTDNVKVPQELIKRHTTQLMLYKSAFELILDKPIKECYIYSFKLEEAIKVEV